MKNLITLFFMAFSLCLQAQTFPAPSTKAMVMQTVGVTDITIDYSSPGVKGRKIYGDVVALNEIWRTGANSATKVTFGTDVQIGTATVPAGNYALFTVPGESKVSVMFNSNWDQGGTEDYDASLDVAKIEVPFTKLAKPMERLQFTIENGSAKGADIVFAWADRTFSVPVKIDTEKFAKANMEKKETEYANRFRVYNDAASYHLEMGNLDEAQKMAEMSTSIDKRFWNVHTLAKVYAAQGNKDMAKQVASESMELAQKAEYQPYVDMNKKLIESL